MPSKRSSLLAEAQVLQHQETISAINKTITKMQTNISVLKKTIEAERHRPHKNDEERLASWRTVESAKMQIANFTASVEQLARTLGNVRREYDRAVTERDHLQAIEKRRVKERQPAPFPITSTMRRILHGG